MHKYKRIMDTNFDFVGLRDLKNYVCRTDIFDGAFIEIVLATKDVTKKNDDVLTINFPILKF